MISTVTQAPPHRGGLAGAALPCPCDLGHCSSTQRLREGFVCLANSHPPWARIYFIFSVLFFLTFHFFFPCLGFPDKCLPLARMQNSTVTSSCYLLRPADPAKPITETPVRMRALCVLHLPWPCIPHYLHDEPRAWTRKSTPLKTSIPGFLFHPTSRDKGPGDLRLAGGRGFRWG